jgi:hypothetical protein
MEDSFAGLAKTEFNVALTAKTNDLKNIFVNNGKVFDGKSNFFVGFTLWFFFDEANGLQTSKVNEARTMYVFALCCLEGE